jgi:aspartate/methionine/tyrosine aminotransferase
MRFEPFLLDEWLDAAMESVPKWNLGSVAGPTWDLTALLNLATDTERSAVMRTPLTYSRAAGTEELREAVAERYNTGTDDVLVVTGASEAILLVFFSAAVPGGNVVLPMPCFPALAAIPAALGLEVRSYRLRPENRWAVDIEKVANLIDSRTTVIFLNSPHNPTGAVVPRQTKRELRAIADRVGASLIADEVFHPIYHGEREESAILEGATIIGDASKALSLPGLRLGWIVERDPERRRQYLSGRMNFTGTNSPLSERLALIAMRNAALIVDRAQRLATTNLQLLSQFLSQWEIFDWVKPAGGTSAFPWLREAGDARPLCQALLAAGVLTVPGDVFGYSRFIRIGFGAEPDFEAALRAAAEVLDRSVPPVRTIRDDRLENA